MSDLELWRESRGPRWFRDVGYALETVVRRHRYDYDDRGAKPTDPGWHVCSCGDWEGYWSGFHSHVADHLRAVVVDGAVPFSRPLPTEPAEGGQRMTTWRDVDSERPRYGLVVRHDGASLYAGRRLYRARWGRP